MNDFGKRLKELRIKSGLTQEELSNRLSMSKSTVSMYENGNRQPDFETQEIIADFFNVDMDYLLGRTEHTTRISLPSEIVLNNKLVASISLLLVNDPELTKMVSQVCALDDKKRVLLSQFLNALTD